MPKSASSGERSPEEIPKRRPPAQDRARRMAQLGNMSEELLEERVRKGTASPTESVALLRLNSPTEIANLERIKAQTALLEAQRRKAEAETVNMEMLERAERAFGRYEGSA